MWFLRPGFSILIVALTSLVVSACSYSGARAPASRSYSDGRNHGPALPRVAFNEQSCLAAGLVRENKFVTARSSLGGGSLFGGSHGGCGAERPFVVAALAQGQVGLSPAATLRCPMVPAVDHWISNVVRPAARRHFGREVVEIKVAASYACRTRNSIRGAKLSEHGRANALDVRAFVLAGGEEVTVKRGWSGWGAEGRFLRQVHKGACRSFTTVLGPNADRYHHDHFHMDLARHGRTGTYRVCK